MKYSDPHLNKHGRPYCEGDLSSSMHATSNGTSQAKPEKQGTQEWNEPSPPPPDTKHPFHTPIEDFLDAIDRHVE